MSSTARRFKRANSHRQESPMGRNNGLVLPQMQQPQPVMNIAQPMNDTQLVALLAANIHGAGVLKTPQDAVETAFEITAWVMVGFKADILGIKLRQIIEAQKQQAEAVVEG